MGTAIKHPMPDRVKPSLVIFDIRALWRSVKMLHWSEQCETSPPTKYRLYGRRFFTGQKTQPTGASIKVLKEKATKENQKNANNKIHICIHN